MTQGVLQPGDEFIFNPLGSHDSGRDISSAVNLTDLATTGTPTKLMMQTVTQDVRYTLDGTAPTTTSGFQLKADDPPIIIPLGASTVVKVIEEAATAVLEFQFGH